MVYFKPQIISFKVTVAGGLGSHPFSGYGRLLAISVRCPALAPNAAGTWDITRSTGAGLSGRQFVGNTTTDEHKPLLGAHSFTVSAPGFDGDYQVELMTEAMLG
jgi:hypothetical protein